MRVFSPPARRVVRGRPLLLGLVIVLCAGGFIRASAPATGPATAASSRAASATSSAAATAPTSAQGPIPASAIPDPAGFRAFDRPGDDGSAILVVWPRPQGELKDAKYVVEIARSEMDFESNNVKTRTVTPSAGVLASAKPEYFGYSPKNAGLYFVMISPAALFPPPAPPELTPERLRNLAACGEITAEQLTRALRVQANTRPDKELTAQEKSEQRWYEGLKAYLEKTDQEALTKAKAAVSGQTWYFRVAVTEGDRKAYVERAGRPVVVSASAQADLFKPQKLNNLIFAMAFTGAVVVFIQIAKRRPGLFIRKIAGLDAVDEAIGRATEMDRPVFFVHGLDGMGSTATIAAVNILSRVARRTAEHDSRVRVMNNDPIVTAVSQEVVQQAYTEAGRPDAYNADDVSLVASDQFSYVAAVSGKMVREQPGAIFLLGYFYAESLLLAETGASTGAIQVAGTDAFTQLPFFVTTCDYTLIGEELYAASAYLSREPRQLGSLRGQDVGKAFLMTAMAVGSIVLTVAVGLGANWNWARDLLFKAL